MAACLDHPKTQLTTLYHLEKGRGYEPIPGLLYCRDCGKKHPKIGIQESKKLFTESDNDSNGD